MIVKEQHVAAVVKEVSTGAEDPQHVAALVGAFMQVQPAIGQYVSAHNDELGLEGVVLTLLHASVLARAVELARGRRRLDPVRFSDLDAAARAADGVPLGDEEPELAGYLEGNITADDATLGGKRRAAALRILHLIARALLERP